MYWGFGVVGVLTALFAAFVMPETRGKTLEQVVAELEEPQSWMANQRTAVRKLCPCC